MRHIGFGMGLLTGIGIAGLIYLVLAVGECLPRDQSAAMHACEAIKRRDFWLYPVLFLISATGSVTLHLRGATGSWLLAATSGLIAAVALMLVNAFTG